MGTVLLGTQNATGDGSLWHEVHKKGVPKRTVPDGTRMILIRLSCFLPMLSMISVALGEMLFGVLNDAFIVYVSIFIGAIGVGIGSIMYSIVDKYHIYAKREEN